MKRPKRTARRRHNRPKDIEIKSGSVVGGWRLLQKLGQGGNGTVWSAERSLDPNHSKVAIKILTKNHDVALQRFKDEVAAQRDLSAQRLALPVLDTCAEGEALKWFAMPLATPFVAAYKGKGVVDKVSAFIQLARSLVVIHSKGYSHRDIKPENILVYDGNPLFSDFGLVKFLEKTRVTPNGERVGPAATIAPEMKRAGEVSNSRPADVYSLAKTLWMIVSEREYGFEGEYADWAKRVFAEASGREFRAPLDDLISACSSQETSRRPTAVNFFRELISWYRTNSEISTRSPAEWRHVQKTAFAGAIPNHVEWMDLDGIQRILEVIAESPICHHTFVPDGGGLDFHGVSRGREEGTLELALGGHATVIRPRRLLFKGFPEFPDWNHFLLECSPLPLPIGDANAPKRPGDSRAYLELPDGRLSTVDHWEDQTWEGAPLPEQSREVIRYFGGSFLWMHRTSIYNARSETYNPYHSRLTTEDFEKYLSVWMASGEFIFPILEDDSSSPLNLPAPDAGTPEYVQPNLAWWSDPKNRPKPTHLSSERLREIIQGWKSPPESSGVFVWGTANEIPAEKFKEDRERTASNQTLLATLSDEELIDLECVFQVGQRALGSYPTINRWNDLRKGIKTNRNESIPYLTSKAWLDRDLEAGANLLQLE